MGRTRFKGCVYPASVLVMLVLTVGSAQATDEELEETQVMSLGSVAAGADDILLSPTGNRIACVVGRRGQKQTVHLDGVAGETYDYIARIKFSADGQHLAQIVRQGVKWFLILDGKEFSDQVDWQSEFDFSPDGKHMAYCVDKKLHIDGKPEGSDGTGHPIFSPDGRHLAHVAGYGKKVVLDRKSGPSYDKVDPPVFAPNSRSVAYAACNDNDWFVRWGKREYGKYEEVGSIVISPDSRHVAYRAMVNKKWRVYRDGKPGGQFEEVGDPVFSRDGKRMAYPARTDDGWSIVLDGKPGECFQEVGPPVFSSDSKLVAFAAKKDGKHILVCDDQTWKGGGDIRCVAFCPKGKHLVMVVEEVGGMRLVCDGIRGPRHNRIIVPERCEDISGKYRFVAIDGGEASLREIAWPSKSTWKDLFAAR